MASIYLLHFTARINPARPAQHYLGIAADLDIRLAEHASGHGARLTQVALERHISWELARTWEGPQASRKLERKLKLRKNSPQLCPICQAARKGAA